MDRDFVWKGSLSANSLQQNARRDHPHLVQRLTNRGEARIMKSRSLNVIEAYHRHISGHVEPMIHQCADGSDGSHIVVANQCRKISTTLNELVHGLIAKLGS